MFRFLLVALFLIVTVLLPFGLWGDAFEQAFTGDEAVSKLREMGPHAWLTAIGLLVADIALPVPSSAIMAALGMIYGPWLGGLIAATGSTLAGLIGYLLCRGFGRPVARWLAGDAMLSYGHGLFLRSGTWLVALSRWQPVLPEVIACLAGLSKMPVRVFMFALLCGTLPLGFVFAAIGHGGQSYPLLTLALSALAPLLLWLVFRPVFRRVQNRSSLRLS